MLPASLAALSLDAPPPFLDLLALPRPLVLAIFALLPVDTRLRCSEVKRSWRALLADTTLFAFLDLSSSSGLKYCSWPLLRAAAAKAGGQLRALDITGQKFVGPHNSLRGSGAAVKSFFQTFHCLTSSQPTRPRSQSCVLTRETPGFGLRTCAYCMRPLPLSPGST